MSEGAISLCLQEKNEDFSYQNTSEVTIVQSDYTEEIFIGADDDSGVFDEIQADFNPAILPMTISTDVSSNSITIKFKTNDVDLITFVFSNQGRKIMPVQNIEPYTSDVNFTVNGIPIPNAYGIELSYGPTNSGVPGLMNRQFKTGDRYIVRVTFSDCSDIVFSRILETTVRGYN